MYVGIRILAGSSSFFCHLSCDVQDLKWRPALPPHPICRRTAYNWGSVYRFYLWILTVTAQATSKSCVHPHVLILRVTGRPPLLPPMGQMCPHIPDVSVGAGSVQCHSPSHIHTLAGTPPRDGRYSTLGRHFAARCKWYSMTDLTTSHNGDGSVPLGAFPTYFNTI